jgi:hypothetical protein
MFSHVCTDLRGRAVIKHGRKGESYRTATQETERYGFPFGWGFRYAMRKVKRRMAARKDEQAKIISGGHEIMANTDKQRVVCGKDELVRFSYLNVFTPKEGQNGGDPKYSMTALIPKTETALKARLDEAIKEAINVGNSGTWGKTLTNPKMPLYDGDGNSASGEPFGTECKGNWVLRLNTKNKPQVINEQGVQLSPDDVKSGDWGRVSFRAYPYSNKAGGTTTNGISFGLANVLFVREGESLGAPVVSAQDDFGIGDLLS